MKKGLIIFLAVVALVLFLFVWIRYYRPIADYGIKAGILNYVVHKGYIWKTYEGELIQTGLQSKAPNSMQSNEFTFSIVDPVVARRLGLASGKQVQLHYLEYLGKLPWRGYSKFIVDSIISIEPAR
jgi:hypothetical protein